MSGRERGSALEDVGAQAREAWERQLRRQISRRRFGALAAAYFAGAIGIDALLAACGGSPAKVSGAGAGRSRAGGIQVVNFFTTENDPNTIAAANQAINDFEAKYPNVHVAMIIISGDERDERARTGLAVGQDLGVFEIDRAYSIQFVQAGYLEPLDDLIKSVGADQFLVGTRQVIRGHDYVFPYGLGPFCLWYRTDLIPSPPKTVGDLITVAREHTGGGKYGFTAALGAYGAVENTFPQFLWSQGTDYFDRSGNVIFGNDRARAAIENVVTLLKYSPPGNTNWSAFQFITNYLDQIVPMAPWAGRLGLNAYEQSPKLVPVTSVEQGPWGPVNAGLTRVSTVAIDRKTAYPDLCKEWIKFYLTGKYGVAYANSVPGQLIPSVASVREAALQPANAAGLPLADYVQAHKDWLTVLSNQAGHGTDPGGPMGACANGSLELYNGPAAPWALEVFGSNAVHMQMLQKIVLQGYSVKDGQAWATDQLKSIVNAYKAAHPDWKKYFE